MVQQKLEAHDGLFVIFTQRGPRPHALSARFRVRRFHSRRFGIRHPLKISLRHALG